MRWRAWTETKHTTVETRHDDHRGRRRLNDRDMRPSYTQKLWMRVKKKAAYLPGC